MTHDPNRWPKIRAYIVQLWPEMKFPPAADKVWNQATKHLASDVLRAGIDAHYASTRYSQPRLAEVLAKCSAKFQGLPERGGPSVNWAAERRSLNEQHAEVLRSLIGKPAEKLAAAQATVLRVFPMFAFTFDELADETLRAKGRNQAVKGNLLNNLMVLQGKVFDNKSTDPAAWSHMFRAEVHGELTEMTSTTHEMNYRENRRLRAESEAAAAQ